MADGTTKPISQVEVGELVLAEDPESGERGPREVTHLWVHQDTIIDLGIDGHDVATTEDHPFWNHTDRQWQRADALDIGDLVLAADGDLLSVHGIDWGSARTTTAYNLSVDRLHTYFVEAGGQQVLVHNTCGVTDALNRLPRGDQSHVRLVPDDSSLQRLFDDLATDATPLWRPGLRRGLGPSLGRHRGRDQKCVQNGRADDRRGVPRWVSQGGAH